MFLPFSPKRNWLVGSQQIDSVNAICLAQRFSPVDSAWSITFSSVLFPSFWFRCSTSHARGRQPWGVPIGCCCASSSCSSSGMPQAWASEAKAVTRQYGQVLSSMGKASGILTAIAMTVVGSRTETLGQDDGGIPHLRRPAHRKKKSERRKLNGSGSA